VIDRHKRGVIHAELDRVGVGGGPGARRGHRAGRTGTERESAFNPGAKAARQLGIDPMNAYPVVGGSVRRGVHEQRFNKVVRESAAGVDGS